MQNRQKQWEYECLDASDADFQPISFDKAVIEKATSLRAVSASCGWRDLGTLAAWLDYTQQPLEKQLRTTSRVDRPWGYYEVLDVSADKTTKRLHVFAGCRLSRQRHIHRSEHWKIESGEAYIENGEARATLHAGQEMTIARGAWHRLVNPTDAPLIIHETQIGVADENDIERCEDDYGRI
ncbi:MAG: cupin domain-containing protein [Alphaproteobacteria bacterium]|nr:cupin domain-containing protein [Alphaproteobacteria bacterium]